MSSHALFEGKVVLITGVRRVKTSGSAGAAGRPATG